MTDTPGGLFSDCFRLPSALPYAGQRFPQFLIRNVQVALRRLYVGVPEHQLDDADVDAVRQQAGAPSCRRSCQCWSSWVSVARSTRLPGFTRLVSRPLATRMSDSHAVLKLSWKSPSGEPKTNA